MWSPHFWRCNIGVLIAVLGLLVSEPAFADNCGSLADCYGTMTAAALVVAAIAVAIVIAAYIGPMILEALATRSGVAAAQTVLRASLAPSSLEAEVMASLTGSARLSQAAKVAEAGIADVKAAQASWGALTKAAIAPVARFFGKGWEGIANRLQNFELPEGITKEALQRAGEVARAAVAAGKNVDFQYARWKLVERALKLLE